MKIEIVKVEAVDAKFLRASCHVRYWEDATVNGVEDAGGTLIPCRRGDCWEPLIDLDTGAIQNWPAGTIADIHYKVCDAGEYSILDAAGAVIKKIDGYVPETMRPGGDGYGDYVIMHVDADGKIADWLPDMRDFSGAK